MFVVEVCSSVSLVCLVGEVCQRKAGDRLTMQVAVSIYKLSDSRCLALSDAGRCVVASTGWLVVVLSAWQLGTHLSSTPTMHVACKGLRSGRCGLSAGVVIVSDGVAKHE